MDNKTKKAQDILRHIDIVLDTHRQFHAFAIKNDRVQLLINTNKVIEGLVETRKMFETHLIKEGVIRKVPVEFIEPVVLKGINGGGHTTSNKHTCTLYVVPPKTTIH